MVTRRALLAGAMAWAFGGNVEATLIDVYQAGLFKGTVEAYTGVLNARQNYDLFSHSAHPVEGPNLRYERGAIFFYDTPGGPTFNVIFNKERETGDPRTEGTVIWSIAVTSSGNPRVVLSDDADELQEIGSAGSTDLFGGVWQWRNNTDGGIIRGLESWSIQIDPIYYEGLNNLRVFSADGSRINMNLNTGPRGNMEFRLHVPVPDAGATLAMMVAAFGALAVTRGARKQV